MQSHDATLRRFEKSQGSRASTPSRSDGMLLPFHTAPLRPVLAKIPRATNTRLFLDPIPFDHSSSLLLAADAVADASQVAAQNAVLDSLGRDILVFLAASVFVVPLAGLANVTPVLGFLALGCAIGPYGFGLFSDSQADVELSDFGILFLLFVEGLNLSPDRLKKLGSFFSLGAAQLLIDHGRSELPPGVLWNRPTTSSLPLLRPRPIRLRFRFETSRNSSQLRFDVILLRRQSPLL